MEYIDEMGIIWQIPAKLGVGPIRQAARELNKDVIKCIVENGEDFALTVFWYMIEPQANQKKITRNQLETLHISASECFAGGKLIKIMSDLISDSFPKQDDNSMGEKVPQENQ
jgi:hypothetical protein